MTAAASGFDPESLPGLPVPARGNAMVEWTPEAVAELFQSYRERLTQCVANWLPLSIRQKFSAEDVVQDAAIAAIRHPERMSTLEVQPFVWFRSLAREALTHRLRAYSGTAKRGPDREVPLERTPLDPNTSRRISVALSDGSQSPSSAFRQRESAIQIQTAVEQLTETDQETIRLLFFEGLSTSEASQVLQISDSSVSTRKLRALQHLRTILQKQSDRFPGQSHRGQRND